MNLVYTRNLHHAKLHDRYLPSVSKKSFDMLLEYSDFVSPLFVFFQGKTLVSINRGFRQDSNEGLTSLHRTEFDFLSRRVEVHILVPGGLSRRPFECFGDPSLREIGHGCSRDQEGWGLGSLRRFRCVFRCAAARRGIGRFGRNICHADGDFVRTFNGDAGSFPLRLRHLCAHRCPFLRSDVCQVMFGKTVTIQLWSVRMGHNCRCGLDACRRRVDSHAGHGSLRSNLRSNLKIHDLCLKCGYEGLIAGEERILNDSVLAIRP